MSADQGAAPKKGVAAVLPVVGGLGLIAVLAAVVMLREPTRVRSTPTTNVEPPAVEEPRPTITQAIPAVAPPTTAAVIPHAHASADAVPAYPEDDDPNARAAAPPSDKDQRDGPSIVAPKAKLTLEEKLEETKKHLPTIERHAAALEQEIKDAERLGRADEAAEKRIRVARLRAHIADLQKAIDEKREPQ